MKNRDAIYLAMGGSALLAVVCLWLMQIYQTIG